MSPCRAYVESALAKDELIEERRGVDGLEDAERRDGVCRRDQSAEDEGLYDSIMRHQRTAAQAERPDHRAGGDDGEDSAEEGKADGRANVLKELHLVHVEARLEDDWREQPKIDEIMRLRGVPLLERQVALQPHVEAADGVQRRIGRGTNDHAHATAREHL